MRRRSRLGAVVLVALCLLALALLLRGLVETPAQPQADEPQPMAAAAQFLCATHRAASALGRSVRFRGLDTPQARAGLALLGLRAAPDCALLPCPLCTQENIP